MSFADLPREVSVPPIPEEMILPIDGSVRLLQPQTDERFQVRPDEMWMQLIEGKYNPMYGHAGSAATTLEYLSVWRAQVIGSDLSLVDPDTASETIGFHHLTNAIARIACHPYRDQVLSLKDAYKQEEISFAREQGVGRDPEQLGLIYNSLRMVVSRA